MIATGSVDGTALIAVSALARRLDAEGARPFSTQNSDAANAWGRGDFDRAVALDPDFGTAWASWIAQTAQIGKPDVGGAARRARPARASLRAPLNQRRFNSAMPLCLKTKMREPPPSPSWRGLLHTTLAHCWDWPRSSSARADTRYRRPVPQGARHRSGATPMRSTRSAIQRERVETLTPPRRLSKLMAVCRTRLRTHWTPWAKSFL